MLRGSSKMSSAQGSAKPQLFGRLGITPLRPKNSSTLKLYNRNVQKLGILGPVGEVRADAEGSASTHGILGDTELLARIDPLEGDFENAYGEAFLDRRNAGPDDDSQFMEIGNPAHPRLRREWERKWGQPWPTDPATGRNYDVAHIKAKADGGTDTVDNIRPMHPDAHRAEHIENGDHSRWSKRSSIARAFGGTVERIRPVPKGGPAVGGGGPVRGLGAFSIIPMITGILSGRIRTDSPDNMWSDMMGIPSQEDQRKTLEEQQRSFNPKWKPGDPIVI